MENYRRPRPTVRPRQSLDGFLPTKTNTLPTQNRPRLQAAPVRPRLPIVQQRRLAPRGPQPYRDAVKRGQAPVAAPARRLPPLDMALPLADSLSHRGQPPIIKRRWARLRSGWFRAAAGAMAAVIIIGGVLISFGYIKLHHVFRGTAASAAALQTNVNPNLLKGEGDGRVNVLLLGIGGPEDSGPDLTDTIMLASIDPVNHKAVLLSIPRDLWVTLPGAGSMKLNAAYETGKYNYLGREDASNKNFKAVQAGFSSVDQELESIIGVPIDYNLLLNFQAFRQAVNTLNGVNINAPTALWDPTMAWANNGNPYLAKKGLNHFDGWHALLYARSRETSTDFARAARQRALILALKQKAVTLGTLANPAKLAGLVNDFGNNVETDLSLGDAARLYQIVKGISGDNVRSVDLVTPPHQLLTTGDLNGQSIVEPDAGFGNYSAIQAFVRSKLPDGYILKEHAKVLVLNGTGITGLGAKETALLKSYGYDTLKPANAPTSGLLTTEVVDLSGGQDKYTRHYLEQRFNTTAVNTLPQPSIKTRGAQFVVLLGGDQAGL